MGRQHGALAGVGLLVAHACADGTIVAPGGSVREPASAVAVPGIPRVTLTHVCGRTFQVTSQPLTKWLMYSHSDRGGAGHYILSENAETYIDGQDADGTSTGDAGFEHPNTGIVSTATAPTTACPSANTPPLPGTIVLKHTCSNGWGILNYNPVPYRLKWSGHLLPSSVVNVPAATTTGPARLYFSTNADPHLAVDLYFGEQHLMTVAPTNEERIHRCDPIFGP